MVAFGGNALVTDAEHEFIPDQYKTVARTVPHLVDIIEDGWGLVVSHGNGPQVGFILRRSEIAKDEVDTIPVDYAVADTQGAIGYMFVKALRNELNVRGLSLPVVALVTQSVVSLDDPAFAEPTKPIGPFLSEGQARSMAQKLSWSIMEDAGRGWRRTVASPRPLKVLETETIRTLLNKGTVVVAAGGGGIPVAVEPDGNSSVWKPWSTKIWLQPSWPTTGCGDASRSDWRIQGCDQLRNASTALAGHYHG